MTSSLGTGRIDDSIAIRAMMPGYPSAFSVSSSQCTRRSTIETVLPDERDEQSGPQLGALHAVRGALHERQGLRALRPERNQQASRGRELLYQRSRQLDRKSVV